MMRTITLISLIIYCASLLPVSLHAQNWCGLGYTKLKGTGGSAPFKAVYEDPDNHYLYVGGGPPFYRIGNVYAQNIAYWDGSA